MARKLIKSRERVRKFAEVLTPTWVVWKMLKLVEEHEPEAFKDPSKTFLEPACGDGNFLMGIAYLKLRNGSTPQQVADTIYGVDIQQDNVDECIRRLSKILPGTEETLRKHIVCGNFLKPETVWFLSEEE